MKPKVVEVETKSHRQDRAVGDAPDIGRVAKMAGHDTAPVSIPSQIDPRDELEEPQSGDWLLRLGLISALLIVLIVAGGIIYFTVLQKINPGPGGNVNLNIPEQAQAAPNLSVDDDVIREEEAMDLVRRGLAVRFASKVGDYFVYSGQSNPPEIIHFLKSLTETDGLVTGMEWMPPMHDEDVARVRVHSTRAGNSQSRDAWIIKNAEGAWRIDFYSFAHKVEPKAKGGS